MSQSPSSCTGVLGAMMPTFLCCFLALLLSVEAPTPMQWCSRTLFQHWPSSSDCPCPRRSRADRWKKPWIHRLVARAPFLVVVLDGMRQDYFERHREALPTLTRLRRDGAWFSNARVNLLPTVTALGHATIGTGADPRVHGIVVNTAFDRISGKPQSPYPGMSPRTLMALSLADLWNLETEGQAVIIRQGRDFVAIAGLVGH